jgi:hypothetical protein
LNIIKKIKQGLNRVLMMKATKLIRFFPAFVGGYDEKDNTYKGEITDAGKNG